MDNLALKYEMGGSGNYLSASLSEEINTYQLKMIENNKINGILPISAMMMNGVYKLQYDITGKSRFIDVLNKGNCSGEAAKRVLRSITYALVHAEDYLLTYKQFLLEKEYVYLDEKGEACFVYLPFSHKTVTTPEDIQNFIKRLLLEHFTADGNTFFLNLLRYISMPEYSLAGLQKKLETEAENAIEQVAVNTPKEVTPQPLFQYKEPEVAKQEVKEEKKASVSGVAPVFSFAVPGMAEPMAMPNKKEEKKEEKKKEKKPSFFESLKGGSKAKEKKEEVFVGKEVLAEKRENKVARNEPEWRGTQIGFGVQENKGTITMGDMTATVLACIRHNGNKIPLDHFPFYVGREEGDYRIPRPRVSGKHLYFTEQEGRFFVVDDNSTNHTYVNGQRIAPYTATEIVSGDTIRLADEEVVFLLEN